MRILVFAACFALLAAMACKSSRQLAYSPVGNWSYVISQTPYGEVSGTFVLTKSGEQYEGRMEGEEGTIALGNLKVADKKLFANFNFQGYQLELTGTFEGEAFDGSVSMDYNVFPMKATRLK